MNGSSHSRSEPGAYRFGPYELDVRKAELRKRGIRLRLQEKPCQILLTLLERPGELVTRDELRARLWGSDTFVDFEHGLDIAVNKLRVRLGDSPESPLYVETVRGKGYRFFASVTAINGTPCEAAAWPAVVAPLAPQPLPIPGAPVLGRSRPFILGASLTAACLGVLLAAAFHYRPYGKPAGAPAVASAAVYRRPALAVLPLRNMKPHPETDFLSLALTDAIVNRLGYISELVVRPTSSVARFRNTEVDPQQAARELDVQTVLTGSYLKEGDDLRVMTELISMDPGRNPWRENIELKYEKLASVQDRVAQSVIHSLGLALQPQEVERIRHGLPTNPVAYEYCLRGNDLSLKSNYRGAVHLLEKSVALEPGNAMAWLDLATNYLAYADVQGGGKVYEEKGWRAFQKALELDPDNQLIVTLSAFHMLEHGRVNQALPVLREALQRNPYDSWAHWYLSEAYRYGGMLQESIREGDLARGLNPAVGEGMLQNTYLYVGQYQEFLKSLPATESARTSFYRGLAYCYLKDATRATEEFDHAAALNPTLLHSRIGRAFEYAIAGERGKGTELLRGIEAVNTRDGEMVYKMAQVSAQLADKKRALRLLRHAIELNFYPYSYFVEDPLLEPLRAEPGYHSVMDFARRRHEAFQKRFF